MASRLNDSDLYRTLHGFVTASSPILEALRQPGVDSDALVDSSSSADEADRGALGKAWSSISAVPTIPGSVAWHSMDVDARSDWWQRRLGTLSATLVSLGRSAGPLADKTGTQAALTMVSQGILLCAIAAEHGVDDIHQRVCLLGSVLFKRNLVSSSGATDSFNATFHQFVEELRVAAPKARLMALLQVFRRLGQMLSDAKAELEQVTAPAGKRRFRDKLPVVGNVSAFAITRAAMQDVTDAGRAWIHENAAQPDAIT